MGAQAEQVKEEIIRRVQLRELMPGDRIDEQELRSLHGLSNTPIREAIIALEAGGILERRPRGGARVASLDLERLIKLVEAHAETEGAVVFRAARRISTKQAGNLRAAANACSEFAEGSREDRSAYYDLNLGFHEAMIAASGNSFLAEAMYRTGNRLIGYFSARHTLPGEIRRSAADHARLCELVLDGQGDAARALMIDHVTMSNAMALDVMNLLTP